MQAPVPKLARILQGGYGKYICVGDSSNLAFLQTIRRLVKRAVGDCELTQDPSQTSMVEAMPSKLGAIPASEFEQLPRPSRTEIEYLVHNYALAASGVIDLFDRSEIMCNTVSWAAHDAKADSATDAVCYLVLAIGAANANPESPQAEIYFNRGRSLANASFMDHPSLSTVQSYVLIAFYLLTVCRRNGAFVLFGIAVRAAHALGIHRRDVSKLFDGQERKLRERLWKSLRVLDLFMSASLGRPPATSTSEGDLEATIAHPEDNSAQSTPVHSPHASAVLRICFVYERILNEVYCRRDVSVQFVDSISKQYRDWNLSLDDNNFDIDGLGDLDSTASRSLQHMVGLTHLKLSYYLSIILLTRPFLNSDVSFHLEQDIKSAASSAYPRSDMTQACIDAALRSIEVASDFVHTPGTPKRPVFVTNALFVAGLVLGLAMFGNYDRGFPLASSLDQARSVLAQLSRYDPSGRRYAAIVSYLQSAASQHIRNRDAKEFHDSKQGFRSLLGEIPISAQTGMITSESDMSGRDPNVDPGLVPQSHGFYSRYKLSSSNIAPDLNNTQYIMEQQPLSANFCLNTGLGDLNEFSEELPIFTLMPDYPLSDMYYG